MKNHIADVATIVSKAVFAQFVELMSCEHKNIKPLPEGKLVANGTGYYDRTVLAFKDEEGQRIMYRTTCPNTGRRILVVPINNFLGLANHKTLQAAAEQGKSLVFFERYTPGHGNEVLIEQMFNTNNAYPETTFFMAELLNAVTNCNW